MRRESRTRKKGKATQRVWMWGGAPRCDSSLAPGSASDWPTAGTDSRCEEESRTRESGMATQRASTRGGAPRCDSSLAPGSASD
uniref:hypothetical protein n=1 Tax=Candidatus Cryptobacteroides bacterium TaxID=3085639 RepID=UPI0040286F40